jgi:hypothetical protein
MILKRLMGLVFIGALALGTAAAEIVVRIAPPRVHVEKRGRAPSRNHVWISGYQRWDGNAYSWNQGRWEQRPQRNSRWVSHRWVHQRNGYVLVDGHWR